MKFIDAKTFEEFSKNQRELIQILNHSITKIKTDIGWLKKLLGIVTGMLAGIFLKILFQ